MKSGFCSRFFSVHLTTIRPRTFSAVNERKSTFTAVFSVRFTVYYITIFAAVPRAYLCHKYAQTAPELCPYYAIITPEFVCYERAMNEHKQTIFAGVLHPNDWAKYARTIGRKVEKATVQVICHTPFAL